MSINQLEQEKSVNCIENPCDAIELVIEPRSQDLGDFSVNRMLPYLKRRMVGPWVFFDHMGPVDFPAGQGIDVRPHPHINLATVTYLFEGNIVHRDSVGSHTTIEPGDINLMVAGKGIVHSERTSTELKEVGQVLNGLQLWLALPEQYEEIDPAFYHYAKDQIPIIDINGVEVTVMIGEAYGEKSPVKTFANTLYVRANLAAGQELMIPKAEALGVYVVKGKLEINGLEVGEHHMAIFKESHSTTVNALVETQIVFIGGENIGERHIYWNFVSSRKERIEQAKEDWKQGKFPLIEGDSDEYIPLPE